MALRWRTSWTRTWRPCRPKIKSVEITPKAVALGAGELIEEVSDGKINGEEDRYSHTDLSDFDANQLGAKQAYGYFKSIIQSKDKALATSLDQGFAAVDESLEPYEISEGVFKPFTTLTAADKATMQSQLAALVGEPRQGPGRHRSVLSGEHA